MLARRKLLVGAQKLYLGRADAVEFARRLRAELDRRGGDVDVAVCPSLINLAHVADVLAGSPVAVGAQNVHVPEAGAFTGQVAAAELTALGVRYVIVGHSELRRVGDSDDAVNGKARICLGAGLRPIVCVGEDRADKEAGRSEAVVEKQVAAALAGLAAGRDAGELDASQVAIAYEPVWAIKTGRDDVATRPAGPDDVAAMHGVVRRAVDDALGDAAGAVPVLYGGSVAPDNAAAYLQQPAVDGLLVGSASVRLESFLAILEAATGVAGDG